LTNESLFVWKEMMDEAKQRIMAMGYDKKDIHLEIYG
jgi:CDP-4-dehydro-6-deoxyglucose reductase